VCLNPCISDGSDLESQVVLINSGPSAGKIAVIAEIIDHNRVRPCESTRLRLNLTRLTSRQSSTARQLAFPARPSPTATLPSLPSLSRRSLALPVRPRSNPPSRRQALSRSGRSRRGLKSAQPPLHARVSPTSGGSASCSRRSSVGTLSASRSRKRHENLPSSVVGPVGL
jgi:hypothetical protein